MEAMDIKEQQAVVRALQGDSTLTVETIEERSKIKEVCVLCPFPPSRNI